MHASAAVRLLTATIDTAARRAAPAFNAAQPAQTLTARGTLPLIVASSKPITAAWKTALEKHGATLCSYLPDNAFLVEATPANAVALAACPDVALVTEFLPEYKIAPAVTGIQKAQRGAPPSSTLTIQTFAPADATVIAATIQSNGGQVAAMSAAGSRGFVRAVVPAELLPTLAARGEVEWIEPFIQPHIFNNVAVQGPRMNVIVAWTNGLTGRGQIVGHADTGLDIGVNNGTLHPDFTNRVKAAFGRTPGRAGAWSDLNMHGTHTAGSILGNGSASTGVFKGVAYEAQLVHQSVGDASGAIYLPADLSDLFIQTYTNGARIQSDSWGSSTYGGYTTESFQSDQFMWNHKDMLLVFSAGNDGYNNEGVIASRSVGAPATAKNVMSVGAAESARAAGSGGYSAFTYGKKWPTRFPDPPITNDLISTPCDGVHQGMAAYSSRGPCNDGRIKPDLVAPGTDIISCRSRATTNAGWGVYAGNTNYLFAGGTSMACPLTAGAAALTRQFLIERMGFTNPSAAAIKALLLNGARSMTPGQYGFAMKREIPYGPRPNSVEGWGQVNLGDTLFPAIGTPLVVDSDAAATGSTNVYSFTIAGTNRFCVTLAWTDYPGSQYVLEQLVNDLDLLVIAPDGATNYPSGTVVPDRINNIEGIDFDPAATGTYTIIVTGYNVPQGPQPYALVMRADAPWPGARLVAQTNVNIVVSAPGDTGTVALALNNPGFLPLEFLVTPFAYALDSSDAPGGPAYQWIDITSNGAPVTPLSDDGIAGPYAFATPFVFYGRTYAQFWVGMNGAILFQPNELTYLNAATLLTLPVSSCTGGMAAVFWRDLDPTSGGPILWSSATNQTVISFINVPIYGFTYASNTFQVVLKSSGEIVYNYQEVRGWKVSGVVGIQGTNVFNYAQQSSAILHNAMTLRFAPLTHGTWLSTTPVTGAVSATGTTLLDIAGVAPAVSNFTGQSAFLISDNGLQPPQAVVVTLVVPEGALLVGVAALLCAAWRRRHGHTNRPQFNKE
ncbi:MAG: S8 family serine peptidase [bacterium]|nr:S8 family serine peptidase [bacterium]